MAIIQDVCPVGFTSKQKANVFGNRVWNLALVQQGEEISYSYQAMRLQQEEKGRKNTQSVD